MQGSNGTPGSPLDIIPIGILLDFTIIHQNQLKTNQFNTLYSACSSNLSCWLNLLKHIVILI